MRSLCTFAAIASLLASFLEAPYFHLHGDPDSDHARKHHHGKGVTFHSHFSHRAAHEDSLPAVQSHAESGDDDAIFLAQATSLTRLVLPPALLPEGSVRLPRPDLVPKLVMRPAHRSHDPPFFPTISPRPPPA